MTVRSPRSLRGLHEAVSRFQEVYGQYLDATLSAQPDEAAAAQLRTELNALSLRAQEGLQAARIDLTVYPPPAVGGPGYAGLRNVAFLHEQPGWRRAGLTRRVRDLLEAAAAELSHMADREARRRKNPFYWLDRGLRIVLGLPAYLISLIAGVPVDRIEESRWGAALRVFSLTVEIGALVVGLHEWLGWF